MVHGRKLYNGLMKEAERRAKMGDHEIAHELRGKASDVMSADGYLKHSKEVQK